MTGPTTLTFQRVNDLSRRTRAHIRKHPEWILGLVGSGFAMYIVSYSLLQFGSLSPIGVLGSDYLQALIGGPGASGQGPIFPFTWASSLLSFVVAFALLRRRTNLDLKRVLIISATIPFAATGSFELSYQVSGSVLQPWAFHGLYPFWVFWTALGFTGAGYFATGRYFWVVFATFLAGFLVWDLSGFSQVEWGPPSSYPIAYAFNIPLKILAFVSFILLLHYGTVKAGSSSPTGRSAPARLSNEHPTE